MILTEEQARELVYCGNDDYELITQIEDSEVYKNYRLVTSVFKDKNGKFFGIDWSQCTDHYGDGGNLFYDCELKPIVEVEVVKKEWKYV